jgi:iron complex outermembrane receptor protein
MLLKEMKTLAHFPIFHWVIFMTFGSFVVCAQAQTSEQLSSYDEDTLTIIGRQIDDIVVSAPVMQTTNSKQEMRHAELNRDNTGQNLPYLLSSSPSLVVTSDDGLGVGYTYFHIRGTDQTRINMTINEVPLNDAAS